MNPRVLFFLAGCLGIVAAAPARAADMHIQVIAATCMACHGPGGKSLDDAIPSLAGLKQDALVKALRDFASGARESTIMKRHAAGYTEAEFEALGAYFAGLR